MNALKKFMEHFGDYGKEEMKMGNLGNRVCAWIFTGFYEVVMFAPINVVISGNDNFYVYLTILAIWAVVGAFFVVNHCVIQSEEGEGVTIYRKLMYVPVARRTIQKVLLQRLLRYVGIALIIAVIIQGSMTLLICPAYLWKNLLYAVGLTGAIPFGTGLLLIYMRK